MIRALESRYLADLFHGRGMDPASWPDAGKAFHMKLLEFLDLLESETGKKYPWREGIA